MFILVDFSLLVARNFYGYFSKNSPDNIEVLVTNNVSDTINNIYNYYLPKSIILCLDGKSPRKQDNITYKSNRVGVNFKDYIDVEKLAQACLTDNIVYCLEEDLEADDIVAIVAFKLKKRNQSVTILSADKDFLQLFQYDINIAKNFDVRGGFDLVTSESIEDTIGVPPEDVLKFRALSGDKSDNIKPAIPRMRSATLKLFVECWNKSSSLDDALSTFNKESFSNARDTIAHNYGLMDLCKYKDMDVPITLKRLKK